MSISCFSSLSFVFFFLSLLFLSFGYWLFFTVFYAPESVDIWCSSLKPIKYFFFSADFSSSVRKFVCFCEKKNFSFTKLLGLNDKLTVWRYKTKTVTFISSAFIVKVLRIWCLINRMTNFSLKNYCQNSNKKYKMLTSFRSFSFADVSFLDLPGLIFDQLAVRELSSLNLK